MPKTSANKGYHITDRGEILDFLSSKSQSIIKYMDSRPNAIFSLWSKNITHSDLISCGKRTKVEQSFEKNILYYLTVEEMKKIEVASNRPFPTAHQSNIGIEKGFYEDLGVSDPRNNRGFGENINVNYNELNVEVFLVNDSIKYFAYDYTKSIVEKLGKRLTYVIEEQHVENEFTPIRLSHAVHGIGTNEDVDFQNLRKNIFVNDTLYLLIEKGVTKNDGTKLFIILEKNPRFFTLAGIANETWQAYQEVVRRQERALVESKKTLKQEEKSRKLQSAWKLQLAKEMMNYTTHEGEVFCPFTNISADFYSVPMLFIASHIKRYNDSTNEEAYDPNNGLLLCANADALFDKHMITVGEDKKLIFSFLIDRDMRLKQRLLLTQPIFEMVLNDERMKYMEDHRRVFFEKEQERKSGKVNEEEDEFLMAAEPEAVYEKL